MTKIMREESGRSNFKLPTVLLLLGGVLALGFLIESMEQKNQKSYEYDRNLNPIDSRIDSAKTPTVDDGKNEPMKSVIPESVNIQAQPQSESTLSLPEESVVKETIADTTMPSPTGGAPLGVGNPQLPEDLQEQLNSPPPDLPEDLREQLNSPSEDLPEDIQRAARTAPTEVSIEEVNDPNFVPGQ